MAQPTRARQRTRKTREARLTYGALAELFRREGPSQQVASTSVYTLDHLQRFFRRRLPESSTIVAYVRRRQKEEGASIQTVNEELWSLAWMFQCALRQVKIAQEDFPHIEFLRDDAARPPRPSLRRERWFSRATSPVPDAPAPPKVRGKKLTDEIWAEHLQAWPVDPKHPERSGEWRSRRLREDYGVEITDTTITRRLRGHPKNPDSPHDR